MNSEEIHEVSWSALVYGNIIYWGTLLGCFVSIIGSIILTETKNNYIDPAYLLTAIYEGKTVEQIWEGSVGALPHCHWYLHHLFTGNGLSELGLVIGIFSTIPACLLCAIIFFLKEKEPLFGGLATIAAAITILSMVGVI